MLSICFYFHLILTIRLWAISCYYSFIDEKLKLRDPLSHSARHHKGRSHTLF